MFCNQCEQTAKGVACTVKGVCGKNSDIADLQDLLMHAVRGLAHFANEGRKVGVIDHEVDRFVLKAIFATLTNVNFDEARFQVLINDCVNRREHLKDMLQGAISSKYQSIKLRNTPFARLATNNTKKR